MSKKYKIVLVVISLVFINTNCVSDFMPQSYLDGLRVLALIPDPVEAGPADMVKITPYIYIPESDVLADQTWTFCPFSLGPTSGYQCAIPACETELTPEQDGSIQVSPGALMLQCVSNMIGNQEGEADLSEQVEKIDVFFRYQVSTASGESSEAILKQTLWTQDSPPTINVSPSIESVTVDGNIVLPGDTADALTEGDHVQIRVSIDPMSMDNYEDQAGRNRTEEAIVSFYTTAGRFDFDRAIGIDTEVIWKAKELEPDQDRSDIYIVVRDLRGGQVVYGPVLIPILP